jgi:hypothetical protein
MALSGGSYASLTDVFNSFLKQGYSPQQAANLTGVMGSEGSAAGGVYTGSFGYQPTENGGVLNPNGAYGIMQANGQQQSLLQNYANQNGLNVNDLDTQTGYLSTQIPPSMANSTYGIVTGYERPAASNIPGEVNNANVIAADRLQDYQQDAADDGIAPQNIGGNSPSPYGTLSPGGGGYGLGVQQSPDTSGGSLTYAGPGDTSQYNANAQPVTQCASAAGIGNIPAGAVTNPGAMSSLPGPLQSILGQSSATATGQGSIVSGPWSMLGTVATTAGDAAIAQATASAEPWEARLRAETEFIRARNAFHGEPTRWRGPNARPDEMPPVIVIAIGGRTL